MSLRNVVLHTNPQIRKKSKAVRAMTPDLIRLIKDMLETMYARNGVGLAAIQVSEAVRIMVYDISDRRNSPGALINPKIIEKKGKFTWVEGCLSVPGLEGEVPRYKNVIVQGKDLNFQDVQFAASDLLAVVFQHECDHMEGVVYVDKTLPGTLKPVKNKDHDEPGL